MNNRPTPSRHITAANATSAGSPTETIHGTCIGARGAGDAFDVVRPADDFAEVASGEMPGDGGGVAEVAADPVRAVGAMRDHDQVLINDANHAAGR